MRIIEAIDIRGDYLVVECFDGATFTLDAQDRSILGLRTWHVHKLDPPYGLYAARTGDTGTILLHREIMQAPKGMTVDHRNGNTLNNRRYNLRICTMAQNIASKHRFRPTSSGYRGVYDKGNGRFAVVISLANYRRYLGTYTDPIEAARVWDQAARQERGEYTQLNFPD